MPHAPKDTADVGRRPTGGFRAKPFRFKLGVGLLILYPVMWAFALVVPFLPIPVGLRAGIVAGDIAAAEILALIGMACVGKEAYQAMMARFRRKPAKPAASPREQTGRGPE